MTFNHRPGGPQSPTSGIFVFLPPLPELRPFKTALSHHIERMIDMLDALDDDPDLEPDADLEPSLAGSGTHRGETDVEADDADDEPSLGSLGGTAMAVDGQHWSNGAGDDLEQDVPTGFRRVRRALAEERDALDAVNRDLRRTLDRLTGCPVPNPLGLRVAL